MPGGLRIHPRKSLRLSVLQRAVQVLSPTCVLAAVMKDQPGLLLAALGFILLARSLTQLDPRDVSLVKMSLGQPGEPWCYGAPGDPRGRSCTLRSQAKLSSVLWLELRLNPALEQQRVHRRLLLFADAMSFEQWRLLHRELCLETHARETRAP